MRTRKSLFALATLIAALAAVSTFDSASARPWWGAVPFYYIPY
jgi:hypothetical protein